MSLAETATLLSNVCILYLLCVTDRTDSTEEIEFHCIKLSTIVLAQISQIHLLFLQEKPGHMILRLLNIM